MKVHQHRKAIGNARATARAAMFAILRDIEGQDVSGQVETPYGPERAEVPATITVNTTTGEGIIAYGRLERLSADAKETDVRLQNREAYTLYWLPYGWDDYEGNPQVIGDDLRPDAEVGANFLTPNSRVWIALDVHSLDPYQIAGHKAYEFVVISSQRGGVVDVVEFEAVLERSEGVNPRTVVVVAV